MRKIATPFPQGEGVGFDKILMTQSSANDILIQHQQETASPRFG